MRLLVALGCGLALLAPAAAGAATGDPPANRTLSQATLEACRTPAAPACQTSTLADLDSARAGEGLGPIQLPGDFGTLTVPQQLLVLSNLERVDRGLAPVIGLSGPLDQDALTGAQNDADPQPTQFNGNAWTANWEGGYGSPFEADFVWMYDDGPGSDNLDCSSQHPEGCWGHRHDILWAFDSPAVMGAASATGQFGASQTELFVGGDTQTGPGQADTPLAPTWATIAATLPFTVSPHSIALPSPAPPFPIFVSVSGEAMQITASLPVDADGWSVAPATCTVAAGSSCTFMVSTARAASGTATTLALQGPNGAQQVALSQAGTPTLRATVDRHTITAGTTATVTGKLLRVPGVAAPGQAVALATRSGGNPIARATTSAAGAVTFSVSPRTNTAYWLSFAGNPLLGAVATGPVTVLVAPRITASFAHRTIAAGSAARLSGRVTPAPGRHRLSLQSKRGRHWVTIASTRADRAGRYHFGLRPRARGRTAYRVTLPATASHARGVSATRSLNTT